ncbi:hypothetical protein LTS17_005696 [Exophiala oligosperma]
MFEQLKPLKRLRIKEVIDFNSHGEGSGLLTFKTVRALYEIHKDSLQVLHISASETPSGSFVAYLSAFLIAAPDLQELHLTWPGLDDDFVDNFPNSVRRLKLTVSSPAQAQTIVHRLAAMRYRLRYLQRIKFSVINVPTTVSSEEFKQPSSSFGLPIPHLAVFTTLVLTWWQPHQFTMAYELGNMAASATGLIHTQVRRECADGP